MLGGDNLLWRVEMSRAINPAQFLFQGYKSFGNRTRMHTPIEAFGEMSIHNLEEPHILCDYV